MRSPFLATQKPRRIAFINLRYRSACAYKLALIVALLFISLWLLDLQAFGLTNNDGDLLFSGTGQSIEETTNLSVPVLAEPTSTDKTRLGGEARESISELRKAKTMADSSGAQNSLASRSNAGNEVREYHACPPSQNLQQERTPLVSRSLNESAGVYPTLGTDYTLGGDSTRERNVTGGEIAINATIRQPASQASLVGPDIWKQIRSTQNLACPQSALLPSVSEYPKVSSADLYAQLLDTPRHFSVEPQILEGNRFRE